MWILFKVLRESITKLIFLVCTRLPCSGRENNPHNETVQSKSFSKDEDKDHANKELWLLCIGPENNP